MKKPFIAVISIGTIGFAQPVLAELSASCVADLAGERLTIVVPNSAGGGNDTYARALAPAVETNSGLSVRVVNMPGANGLAATNFVAGASTDDIVILIENSNDLALTELEVDGDARAFVIDQFDILGIVNFEPDAWLGLPGLDLNSLETTDVVSAQGNADGSVISLNLAAMGMGMSANIVAGYEGSGDMAAAVLRNEVDLTVVSATTALKNAASSDLDVLMTISDGPWAKMPELPYLAGEGSISWQRTEALEEPERQRLRDIATTAANLGGTVRGLHISINVPQDRRDCLSQVMSQSLTDPVFIETAESQGRPVDAVTVEDAREMVRKTREVLFGSIDVIDQLRTSLANQ